MIRAALPVVALMLAAGCDRRQAAAEEPARVRDFDGNGQEVASPRRVTVHEGHAIIDQAGVLSAAEKTALEQRSATVSKNIGRGLTVVLLRPSEGDSLEQVTWAIAPRQGADRPLMLVVDVDAGALRIDGASDAAKAAAVAGAIGAEIKAGRVASGVARGLDQLAVEERRG